MTSQVMDPALFTEFDHNSINEWETSLPLKNKIIQQQRTLKYMHYNLNNDY